MQTDGATGLDEEGQPQLILTAGGNIPSASDCYTFSQAIELGDQNSDAYGALADAAIEACPLSHCSVQCHLG